MTLSQLVYMSSLNPDNPAIMPDIVESSARNNARRGITGMLLYVEGNILQAIEGPERELAETFGAIKHDERHRGIVVLYHDPIDERGFPLWSMGYKQLSLDELSRMPGADIVFKATPTEIERRSRPGEARILLKSFI